MRVLLQRVSSASVVVEKKKIAAIDRGYLLLVGIREGDTRENAEWSAKKIADLRLFEDADGKMNLSLRDVGGDILVVSQFTLYGDARKGRRPSYSHAARPENAEPLCTEFAQLLRDQGFHVEEGQFAAHMEVSLCNDGPVTLILERESAS